jgi:hypothetical protein
MINKEKPFTAQARTPSRNAALVRTSLFYRFALAAGGVQAINSVTGLHTKVDVEVLSETLHGDARCRAQ